jgi:Ca-activated chloride channel family protein
MRDVLFAYPLFLHGLWLILLFTAIYVFNAIKRKPLVQLPSLSGFFHSKLSWKVRLRHLPFVLRMLAFSLFVVSLARPQSKSSWQDLHTEGIDIMMGIDVSASMLAKDLKPNRLEAAKNVATDFIANRPDDRLGLVIFSGESFTQCPLTSDHSVLVNLFSQVRTGVLEDGTAIGMGLASAINRLKDSKAKSKVVILLTDGVNNAGAVSPLLAAELAKPYNIRVYTIGVGSRGSAYAPVRVYPNGEYIYDYVKVEIDEKVLNQIASLTGGKYFRATNNNSLKKIYAEIDKMEKTIVEEKQYSKRTELFRPLALFAAALLLIDFLLRLSVFKSATPLL